MSHAFTTVIVTVKDNVHRTHHFLRNSLYPEFRYLILDGSVGDENEQLFSGIQLAHVTYVRSEPDVTMAVYHRKIASGLQRLETPFALMLDAGDYLLPGGVRQAEKTLSEQSEASCAGGDIYFAREGFGLIARPFPDSLTHVISGMNLRDALAVIPYQYSHLWYAVHRSLDFAQMWLRVAEMRLPHPAQEFYPTIATLSRGPYVDTGVAHLLRVKHGPRSWTKYSLTDPWKAGSDKDLIALSLLCQTEFGVPAQQVFEAFSQEARRVASSGQRWVNLLRGALGWVPLTDDSKVRLASVLAPMLAHYSGLIRRNHPLDQPLSLATWQPKRRRLAAIRALPSRPDPRD